ncbi:MAG: dTDP-4-dehydrorhamnose 3,5-epimerase family protein [Planctomycetaceae bacterium]|jgi:dTDP-4-dehydrorhamnose 3,5-epimerase|nr:dTDP-4-dehydrorhamnose 3,5-epimerase family protein [Planctomycetaceae bacterium]
MTNKKYQPKITGITIEPLSFHYDKRGWLVELFRQDELEKIHYPVMAYLSETLPGIGRGPHEHQYQTDVFLFIGPGDLKLCLWDNRPDSNTYRNNIVLTVGESNPCRIIVPPGVVHGYRNISNKKAIVFNAPNQLFAGKGRGESIDEIRYEDKTDSPYQFD